MNKMIQKFENFNLKSKKWRDEFLQVYDIFCELEDSNIAELNYQAGIKDSQNITQIMVFLKNGDILGREEFMDKRVSGKIVFNVSIHPNFKNNNHSPFHGYTSSFFGPNADIFLSILKYVDVAKNRIPSYTLCISIHNDSILISFLEKDK